MIGVVCLYLPVAEYPNIVPPTIQVTTNYPGASAEVVAATVGIPIEQAINGVEDSIYMESTSGSDGSYTLTVTFASAPTSIPRCRSSRTPPTARCRSSRRRCRRRA